MSLSETVATDEFYGIPVQTIDGQTITMDKYRGSVLLIVNVASRCVLTKQYADLQSLYDRYANRNFFVLGFPCNQFKNQEPKGNAEIQQFCSLTYNVTFPMFAKVDVNGQQTHPIFQHLKHRTPGLFGSESIKWNFNKFLVSRDATVVKRFGPSLSYAGLERALVKML